MQRTSPAVTGCDTSTVQPRLPPRMTKLGTEQGSFGPVCRCRRAGYRSPWPGTTSTAGPGCPQFPVACGDTEAGMLL